MSHNCHFCLVKMSLESLFGDETGLVALRISNLTHATVRIVLEKT